MGLDSFKRWLEEEEEEEEVQFTSPVVTETDQVKDVSYESKTLDRDSFKRWLEKEEEEEEVSRIREEGEREVEEIKKPEVAEKEEEKPKAGIFNRIGKALGNVFKAVREGRLNELATIETEEEEIITRPPEETFLERDITGKVTKKSELEKRLEATVAKAEEEAVTKEVSEREVIDRMLNDPLEYLINRPYYTSDEKYLVRAEPEKTPMEVMQEKMNAVADFYNKSSKEERLRLLAPDFVSEDTYVLVATNADDAINRVRREIEDVENRLPALRGKEKREAEERLEQLNDYVDMLNDVKAGITEHRNIIDGIVDFFTTSENIFLLGKGVTVNDSMDLKKAYEKLEAGEELTDREKMLIEERDMGAMLDYLTTEYGVGYDISQGLLGSLELAAEFYLVDWLFASIGLGAKGIEFGSKFLTGATRAGAKGAQVTFTTGLPRIISEATGRQTPVFQYYWETGEREKIGEGEDPKTAWAKAVATEYGNNVIEVMFDGVGDPATVAEDALRRGGLNEFPVEFGEEILQKLWEEMVVDRKKFVLPKNYTDPGKEFTFTPRELVTIGGVTALLGGIFNLGSGGRVLPKDVEKAEEGVRPKLEEVFDKANNRTVEELKEDLEEEKETDPVEGTDYDRIVEEAGKERYGEILEDIRAKEREIREKEGVYIEEGDQDITKFTEEERTEVDKVVSELQAIIDLGAKKRVATPTEEGYEYKISVEGAEMPDYIPEDLRSRKILQEAVNAILEGRIPDEGSKAWEAYQVLLEEGKKRVAEVVPTAEEKTFYHGTLEDFEEFSMDEAGKNTAYDNAKFGIFFTDQKDMAKEFVETTRRAGDRREAIIKEAKLDLKNPLDLRAKNIENEDQVQLVAKLITGEDYNLEEAKEVVAMATNTPNDYAEALEGIFSNIENKKLIQEAGYDGIIGRMGEGVDEYVVFDTKQIIQEKEKEEEEKTFEVGKLGEAGVTEEITLEEARKEFEALSAKAKKLEEEDRKRSSSDLWETSTADYLSEEEQGRLQELGGILEREKALGRGIRSTEDYKEIVRIKRFLRGKKVKFDKEASLSELRKLEERQKIIDYLKESRVEFDEEASLEELRKLQLKQLEKDIPFRTNENGLQQLDSSKLSDENLEEFKALNRKLFGDEKVEILEQILSPDGQEKLGRYLNDWIQLRARRTDIESTYYHESGHKAIHIFLTPEEKKRLLDQVIAQYGEDMLRKRWGNLSLSEKNKAMALAYGKKYEILNGFSLDFVGKGEGNIHDYSGIYLTQNYEKGEAFGKEGRTIGTNPARMLRSTKLDQEEFSKDERFEEDRKDPAWKESTQRMMILDGLMDKWKEDTGKDYRKTEDKEARIRQEAIYRKEIEGAEDMYHLYNWLAKELGGKEEASSFLASVGFDGAMNYTTDGWTICLFDTKKMEDYERIYDYQQRAYKSGYNKLSKYAMAEEQICEDIIGYINKNTPVTFIGKLKAMVERFIDRWFKTMDNIDTIEEFYEALLSGRLKERQRRLELKQAKAFSNYLDLSNERRDAGAMYRTEVAKKIDRLTTKILKMLGDRKTVSKQFIRDLTKQKSVKKEEADLINEVLNSFPDKIEVETFKEKVLDRLLPLERATLATPKYDGVRLVEYKTPSVKYNEHIYASPIRTFAGYTHFGTVENFLVDNEMFHMFEGKNKFDPVDRYFGHTRTEDEEIGSKSVRRVLEVQSDLYQLRELEEEEKKKEVSPKGLERLKQYNDPTAHFRMVREEVRRAALAGMDTLLFPTGETAMKIERLESQAELYMRRPKKRITEKNVSEVRVGDILEVRYLTGRYYMLVTEVIEANNEVRGVKSTFFVSEDEAKSLGENYLFNPYKKIELKDEKGNIERTFYIVERPEVLSKRIKKLSKWGSEYIKAFGEEMLKMQDEYWAGGGTALDLSFVHINENAISKVAKEFEKSDSFNKESPLNAHAQLEIKLEETGRTGEAGIPYDVTDMAHLIYEFYHLSFQESKDVTKYKRTGHPVYRFYESTMRKFLKKEYDAEYYEDDNGYSWWKVDIKPEYTDAVEAFRAETLVDQRDVAKEFDKPKEELTSIRLPELVSLVNQLDADLQVKGKLGRKKGATKLGDFSPVAVNGKDSRIRILRDLFEPKGEEVIEASTGEVTKLPETDEQRRERIGEIEKVLAHEIGHLFDWYGGEVNKTLARGNLLGRVANLVKYMRAEFRGYENKEIKNELKTLTQMWNPFDESLNEKYTKYRYSSRELYAEAISVLLNDPTTVRKVAPNFYNAFIEFLARKEEVKEAYFNVIDSIKTGTAIANRVEAIHESHRIGEKKRMTIAEEEEEYKRQEKLQNVLTKLDMAIADEYAPYLDKMRKLWKENGIEYSKLEEIEKFMGDQRVKGNDSLRYVDDIQEEFFKPISEAGIDVDIVGDIMELDRDLGDREDIANPHGLVYDYAKETYEYVKNLLTPEQWNVLQDRLKWWRDYNFNLVKKGYEAGVYSEKFFKEIATVNKNTYTPFAVVDYINDNYVKAGIIPVKGTTKGVENPLTTQMLKSLSLIKLTAENEAKQHVVKNLKENFPDEVVKAKAIRDDKGRAVAFEKNKKLERTGYKQVELLEDGKKTSYYIDKYIAGIWEHDYGGIGWSLYKFVSFPFRATTRIFKPLVTTLEPSFQFFSNPIKDYKRSFRNLTALSGLFEEGNTSVRTGKVFKSFTKAWFKNLKRSWDYAGDEVDEIMKKMEDLYAIQRFVKYEDIDLGTDTFKFDPVKRKVVYKGSVNWLESIRNFSEKLPVIKHTITPLYDLYVRLGRTLELNPKVAGFQYLEQKVGEEKAALYTRKYIGTPDYMQKGKFTPITNELFPFTNVSIQGLKADAEIATRPKTSSGYWYSMMLTTVLPKLLMVLGASMLKIPVPDPDDEDKTIWIKPYDYLSEYYKSMYFAFPVGYDKETKKVLFVKIPQDETAMLVGATVWKMATYLQGEGMKIGQLASVLAGFVPFVDAENPLLGLLKDWQQYAQGRNPYDDFRGRLAINPSKWEEGGMTRFVEMLKWSSNEMGLTNFQTYDKEFNTTKEYILEAPILERMFELSDFGIQEREIWEDMQAKKEKNKKRDKLLQDYYAQPSDEMMLKKIDQYIKQEMGDEPEEGWKGEEKANATRLKNDFKMEILAQSGDPKYTRVAKYGLNNDEKEETIKGYQERMDKQEFTDYMAELVRHEIVKGEMFAQYAVDNDLNDDQVYQIVRKSIPVLTDDSTNTLLWELRKRDAISTDSLTKLYKEDKLIDLKSYGKYRGLTSRTYERRYGD